jgi:hypothetical protein
MSPKHPAGPAMTLDNMRELGVGVAKPAGSARLISAVTRLDQGQESGSTGRNNEG